MTQRINLYAVSPKAIEPMLAIEAYIKTTSLEPALVHLVKTRASQVNGCANCLHMHTSDAIAEAYALRVAGIAKTSMESRFAESDDVTGSLGFLCGLQPGQKPTGAAAARGYDPNGRFLGAKLSIALK